MAFAQEDIERLEQAIAKGERIVRFADRSIEYRSIKELIEARDRMLTERSNQQPPQRSRLTRLYHAGKGL